QLGIFGVLLLLGLVAVSFVRLWRMAVRNADLSLFWPLLMFVGLVVQNLTESRLLLESGWALFTLLVIKNRLSPIDEIEQPNSTLATAKR
ncbi:MAG: hypothetical protein RL670_505, partial [Actinomycetota bacterium]